MGFSGCPGDAAFGPTVHGCREDFDFTLKFEKIFFSLVPASVFILLSGLRSLWLVRKPIIVDGRILQSIKVGAMAAYAALQLALLVLISTNSTPLAGLFISSATLELVATLCMLTLSWLEQRRSPRPSILLSTYLLLTLLFDIAQSRSLWLAAEGTQDRAFARVFTTASAVKAVLVLTESRQKSQWIQWDQKRHSPEQTSGIYALATLSWLNRLFLDGYKKVLTLDDLLPLDYNIASETLGQKLEDHLAANPAILEQKYGLAKALAKILAVPLLLPVPPRLAYSAFNFCQPFLINSVLNYIQSPASEKSANPGYGLIGATILVYTGISVSHALYYYFQERALWMARGALASTIYRKTAQAKISAANNAAALTLMSTDIERIRLGFLALHDFWVSFVEVSVASWLLYRQLGAVFVAPITIVILCVFSIAIVAHFSESRQKVWMERVQKRVGLTSNVIANMKHLKISGLTDPVEKLVQQLRIDELSASGRWRMIMIISFAISFAPSLLSPVFTFAFATTNLDVARIFTSLSVLTLLTTPLSEIFQLVPPFLAAITCLGRIQTFLGEESREDFREIGDIREKVAVSEKASSKLTISKGSFGWKEEQMCLKNLDIEILTAGLTVVVGPIASGKSSFCKVLLGEIPVYKGQTAMDTPSRRIGYCEQVPFLSNASIRENIIGYSSFNAERYHEVIEATMLLPDLAVLPEADRTKIGSNGITLSGGQKQRVSMARALYLESDFLIFDDVLSGLDADTEEQVFQRVFGPHGLIRHRGATTILCTHSVHHLPSADHIIALGVDGSLVEQGTYDQLVTNRSYVHSLDVKDGERNKPKEKDNSFSLIGGPMAEKVETQALTQMERVASTASAADEMSRQIGDSTVYKHYAKSMNPVALLSFLGIGMTMGFLFNFPQVWLNYWATDLTKPFLTHSRSYWIGIYAMLQVSSLICLVIASFIVFITMITQAGANLHLQALRTVITAPLRFFTTTDAGVVINLFSQDMTLIDTELPRAILNVVVVAFISIGMAALVATSSPYIAICYPFLIAILWLLQRFYLRTSRQLRLLDLEAKSPLYTHFTDTINGVATLRAFDWIKDSLELNNKLLDDSQRPAYLLSMIQQWLNLVLFMIVTVLATLVVVFATQVKSITGSGFTGASLVTLMSFGGFVSHLIMMYTLLETSIGAVSRLKSFSENVVPENLPGEDTIPLEMWPLHGAIDIKGVSASYAYSEDDHRSGQDTANLALKDLNVSIKPGERVAICGRSGSGKSSTILLLLRLLDPIPGCTENIIIDGQQLDRIDRSILRQRIIAVPQDAVFLPNGMSFKANLDPFGVSTTEECRDVFEAVGLWQLVEENGGLEEGMSADVLSQGQKQLFNLARAILRRRIRSRDAHSLQENSEIRNRRSSSIETVGDVTRNPADATGGLLLLDEVSSSVDKATDVAMQAVIKREFEGYTIVMVSHRLDMVMDFDTVLIMDKGSIIESGNPRELLNEEKSHFRELYHVANGL